MFKKDFSKALIVLAIMISLTTLFSITTLAVEENTVMTVYTKLYYEEITKEFDNFEDGWVYALEQSLEKTTTITLYKDWIAPDGTFYCENKDGDEYGTDDGYLYINDNHILTIDLNGHKIDRNLKTPTDDGVVFWLNDLEAKLTIKDSVGGGKITGANNDGDGGAFYAYNGSLYIEGGEITGNYAENGAGIYWYSDNDLCITGGKITENEALEKGGGIYHDGGGLLGGNADNIYFGGDTQIYDNLGAGGENNNVYIAKLQAINRTAGQTEDIPDVLFTDTAKIGVTTADISAPISGPDSCFKWGNDTIFFADNDELYIKSIYNAAYGNNACMLFIDYLANKPEPPEPIEAVMTVTVDNDATFEFSDFGKGWAYAMKQSLSKSAEIKLYADWVAENGKFICLDDKGNEYGSEGGYLYLNDDHVLTIDLNGHTIDRNLNEATDNGFVFRLYDYEARLIIKDSVGGGKITGANNKGNGGAFLVERGGLYILGGEISGNKAKNGAGVYWESQGNLCICNCEITGNEALENGGGIYGTSWGKMYFGGLTMMTDNTGKDGAANNLYLAENAFVYGTAWQDEYIPNESLSSNARIGITAYITDGIISGENAKFSLYFDSFYSDSDKYYIRSERIYTSLGYTNELYISTLDAPLVPGAMTVSVEDGEKKIFDDFGKGWVYALKTSLSEQVTIKLGADWVAHNGKFICRDADGNEYGSKDGYLYLNDNHDIVIDLNGHTIDRNLSEPTKDGVIFWLNDSDAKLTFDGYVRGKLTGANNTGNGGAFYVYNGSVWIDGCEISGNKAKNGAAIYWESSDTLALTAAIIQGNEASENGGGIYATNSGDIYFGGYILITENTGANGKKNNLYLANDSVVLNSAKKQEEGVPYRILSDDTVIGISSSVMGGLISGDNSCFQWGEEKCFVMDNEEYYVRMEYDASAGNNACQLYIDSIANKPGPIDEIVTVSFEKGVTIGFDDFKKAWVYALKQSLSKPATITLKEDLVAPEGGFCYLDENGNEYGTRNGHFYLNDNYNVIIDLNGHTIDRNLKEATENGVLFWLYDYDAKLTIKDSIGGGKITGANNTGNGGAFFIERGSIYIEGGEITGNKAKNGAGIYWESQGSLCIYGGKITGNEASENGGGIYTDGWGKIYFGGYVEVTDNKGKDEDNIGIEGLNNFYIDAYNKLIVYATNGQEEDIPVIPLDSRSVIRVRVSASNSNTIISGENSGFEWNDYQCFKTDEPWLSINPTSGYTSDNVHYYGIRVDSFARGQNEIHYLTGYEGENRVQSARISGRTITITCYLDKKDEILNLPPDLYKLVHGGSDAGVHFEYLIDWSAPVSYILAVRDDNGIYDIYTLYMNWVCREGNHEDTDGDFMCENCGVSIFKIRDYNKETKEVTVNTPKAGTYTLVFADYEGEKLSNLDIVEYKFAQGVNVVGQEILDFELGEGDKVMLWYDMVNLAPVCDALTVE